MKTQNPNVAQARSGFAGHAKQEIKELVQKLDTSVLKGAALVPNPANATGWDVGHISLSGGNYEQPISKGANPAPDANLLLALAARSERTILAPQAYSVAAKRDLRFAVILPPNFDASRPGGYKVMTAIPSKQSGRSLAYHFQNVDLAQHVENYLLDNNQDDAIVVIPELSAAENNRSNHTREATAVSIVMSDLVPYVRTHLNGEDSTINGFSVPELQPISMQGGFGSRGTSRKPGKSLRGQKSKGEASSRPTNNDAQPAARPNSFFDSVKSVFSSKPSKPRIVRDFEKTSNPIYAAKWRFHEVLNAKTFDGLKPGKKEVDLPSKASLRELTRVDRPVLVVAQKESAAQKKTLPYAVLLPANFDSEKKPGYAVQLAMPKRGQSLKELVGELADSAAPPPSDTIVLIPDMSEAKGKKGFQTAFDIMQNEVLADIETTFPVNLSTFGTKDIPAKTSDWSAAISSPHVSAQKLTGAVVTEDGQWTQLAPSNNYKVGFPGTLNVKRTEKIPKGLQKQNMTQGTFFAPVIKSKAIGGTIRTGVYLPPGYDPDSSERYPVTVMLPGMNNPLHYWTTAGGLISKLDEMMAPDDAQKMIVIIPDNTNSFWFNYDEYQEDTNFGKKGKRNFEDLILKELVPYAIKELKGDGARLSIGGISRGGYGAIGMAMRNPGVFQSVSVHSGMLALGEKSWQTEHFGPAGGQARQELDLIAGIRNGAADDLAIHLDCGADDKYFTDDAVAFSVELDDRNIGHSFNMLYKEEGEVGHNWECWAPMVPSWIAFHQAAHGNIGPATIPSDILTIADSLKDAFTAERSERILKTKTLFSTLPQALGPLEDAAAPLLADPSLAEPRSFESTILSSTYSIHRSLSDLRQSLAEMKQVFADTRKSAIGESVLARETACAKVQGDIDTVERAIASAKRSKASWAIGTPSGVPTLDPNAFSQLSDADQRDVRTVIQAFPETEQALLRLATVSPDVFGKGRITKRRFALQLKELTKSGPLKLKADEKAGLVEYIERMAQRRFDWRRGGFSHSVCAFMPTVFTNPGMVLEGRKAAILKKDIKVGSIFKGDDKRVLPPLLDFQNAFRSVPEFSHATLGGIPEAELGYERALLWAVRYELAPSAHKLPKDRFASLCDPVAVGMSKMTGDDVRYGYLFGLKNGDDLKKAVLSQGDAGLALADVELTLGSGRPQSLHFPTFYDYDASNNTVAMQEWGRREQRISLDNLKFATKGRQRPAGYFRENDVMKTFWTPWEQKNWAQIKSDYPEMQAKHRAKKAENKKNKPPIRAINVRSWEPDED